KAVHSRWSRNGFGVAARPADLDLIDLHRLAQTEVWPLIGAGSKASSRQDIGSLREAIRRKQNAGPHGIARTTQLCGPRSRRPHELERDPVIAVVHNIAQQRRR